MQPGMPARGAAEGNRVGRAERMAGTATWLVPLLGVALGGCSEPPPQDSPPRSLEPTPPPPAATPPSVAAPSVLANGGSEEVRRVYRPRAGDPAAADHPIEDAAGALAPFYAALARIEEARTRGRVSDERSLVRVTHMGDSGLDRDQLPHLMRRRFQERFGDGGAGYVLLQPESSEYRNRAVELAVPSDWRVCSLLRRCRSDGHYGLGGVVAESAGGAATVVRTRRDGKAGRSASRVELWYAVRPGGGRLELTVDDREPIVLDTEAPALDDRWHAVRMAPGPHRVHVRATGDGVARAYGLVLETDGPGVVWDTVSMSGAFTPRLLEQDAEHFARHLHHRRSDLVVLRYGGNDLRRYLAGHVTADEFQRETVRVLERVRSARRDIACLLTGIVDHGKSGPMWIRSEHVEALVEAQRRAAREAGCAFFDQYQAMGGAGAIHRWAREGLAGEDLEHLTLEGRRRMASWLYEALLAGYVQYRMAESAG